MTVSEWAVGKFGKNAATAARAIAGGLNAGHLRAVGSHEAGGLATADGYGSVLWLAVAEEIGQRLAEIDGSRRIRPDRARYWLGVVNNNIVFPQRIASDLRTGADEARLPMSQVKADLFSLAPAPAPKLEPLRLWDDEDLVVDQDEVLSLDGVADMGEAGLVVVAYVSSPDGGLLRAWWGEAALIPDRALARLEWRYREQLDLTSVESTLARPHLTVVSRQAAPKPAPRFDSAELEDTPLGVRPPLTPVTSEPQPPAKPAANSDYES